MIFVTIALWLMTVILVVQIAKGPWAMLMFGVVSTGILTEKWEKRMALIVLIPELITLYFFPTHNHYMTTAKEIQDKKEADEARGKRRLRR
ncbi:Hypothetical protein LUCI_2420 [Lucifera butyrica]|uniref:Uncharacterized protein n=1 Tax=Lucifera butyrica TaxID=1351585 RepID=A0A498R3E3_9FIRM|nr:hypothetical protein [Lucifera butyrica]VBB07176.1 Hypothetical protein LUCI_2420 [Lucifera butyrica]